MLSTRKSRTRLLACLPSLLLVTLGCAAQPRADNESQREQVMAAIYAAIDIDPHSAFPLASALGSLGRDAVPYLIRLLGHKNPNVVNNAAIALGTIGPDAREAVQPLVKVLKEGDTFARPDAAKALAAILGAK